MKVLRTLVLQRIPAKRCQPQLSISPGLQPDSNHFGSLLNFSCVTQRGSVGRLLLEDTFIDYVKKGTAATLMQTETL